MPYPYSDKVQTEIESSISQMSRSAVIGGHRDDKFSLEVDKSRRNRGDSFIAGAELTLANKKRIAQRLDGPERKAKLLEIRRAEAELKRTKRLWQRKLVSHRFCKLHLCHNAKQAR